MKSKVLVSVFSVLGFMSLTACGPNNQPHRYNEPRPAVYNDGSAELAYIDADTGAYEKVQFGLRKIKNKYVAAAPVFLPADLPNEIYIQTTLPQTNPERRAWNYVPTVALDGQPTETALATDPDLVNGNQGEVYSARLVWVRETLPKVAVSGTFKILLFDPNGSVPAETVEVRFKKPASTR